MKHKTWFRLVIKAIGVLLIGFAIPDLATSVSYFLMYEIPQNPAWEVSRWVYAVLPGSIQTAIGFYLFLDGRWIINMAIPSNRPYCPECGYDISQLTGVICPECGVEVRNPSASSNTATHDPKDC